MREALSRLGWREYRATLEFECIFALVSSNVITTYPSTVKNI
jgi:hypothetical protein